MTISVVRDSGSDGHSPRFRGWQMVARGFMCQNVATGFLFGTFATTLLAMQRRLGTSVATVALGLSLALLTMGLISLLTSQMLERLTLRWTMVSGIVLSGLGYALLALAPGTPVYLFAYAMLIGPGFAMFGALPSSILASNWFVDRQGTAVGIVNISLFVTIMPLFAIALLERFGLTALYLTLAAFHVLLLPAALTIVERPALIGQRPLGAGHIAPTSPLVLHAPAPRPVPLLSSKAFWVMVAGGGTLNGVGVVGVSHMVAIALERGLSALGGSLLVSVSGGASMLGAFVAGVLCDRIGPARVLALMAGGACLAWTCMFVTLWIPALIFAVALHGICVGGVYPGISVLSRHLFGVDAMARAIGLFLPLTLPMMFCAAPVAGWARDRTGSYNDVIIFVMISTAVMCGAFLGLWRAEARIARDSPVPATI